MKLNLPADKPRLTEFAEAVAPGVSRVRPAVFRTVNQGMRPAVAPPPPAHEGLTSRGSAARKAYATPVGLRAASPEPEPVQPAMPQPAAAPMRPRVARVPAGDDLEQRLAPLRGLSRELVSRGMPGTLVGELLTEIVGEFGNQVLASEQDARYALVEQLMLRVNGEPLIDQDTPLSGTFLIAGPSSSGKEVLVAHMALAAVRQGHRDIVLVNAESERIGAAAQMEALGTVFNCRVEHVYAADELRDLRSHCSPRTLMLILADGWSPVGTVDKQAGAWWWQLPNAQRIVCVPATGQAEDLLELLTSAREKTRNLTAVLTKTGETRNVLPAVGALASVRQPVAMVVSGDSLIDTATAQSLATLVRSALSANYQPRKKGRIVC